MFVKTVPCVWEVEHHLKVDGVEGIGDSSVSMKSCHLEGQSGSDHVQRVGAYHRSHPWEHKQTTIKRHRIYDNASTGFNQI